MNPKSLIRGISLSDLVGLSRIGLHLVRIPPGFRGDIRMYPADAAEPFPMGEPPPDKAE
jgi:uncharacterized cupin superfamily protein